MRVSDVQSPAPALLPRRPYRCIDEEFRGLELSAFERTDEPVVVNGTMATVGPAPCPFPPRAYDHRLLTGRSCVTALAVPSSLGVVVACGRGDAGWSDCETASDIRKSALCALGTLSIGSSALDPEHPDVRPLRDCRRSLLTLARSAGDDDPLERSEAEGDLRSLALTTLALAEWRALTWTVLAKAPGERASARLVRRLSTLPATAGECSVVDGERALDLAWTLLALHVASLAEFSVDPAAVRIVAEALDRAVVAPGDESATQALAVARALFVAFHAPSASRGDIRTALRPALDIARTRPDRLQPASELTFLLSIAVMQIGGDDAREWDSLVLHPLAARTAAASVEEHALTAMCLTSYYRYVPRIAAAE